MMIFNLKLKFHLLSLYILTSQADWLEATIEAVDNSLRQQRKIVEREDEREI